MRRDAEMIAKVIALYAANNSRTASPKYLLGESYGGFRAAKVARAMQIEQGLPATGIVMVSPMLDTALQWAGASNALGAALHFPSLAAAELDRTKTLHDAEKMAEIERFALNDYLPDARRPAAAGERAAQFYGTLATMTGLPIEAVEKSRGYVRAPYLAQLRAKGQVASSYDGAFLMPDPFPGKRVRSAAATRCSTASHARCPAPSSATRATSSASRPR